MHTHYIAAKYLLQGSAKLRAVMLVRGLEIDRNTFYRFHPSRALLFFCSPNARSRRCGGRINLNEKRVTRYLELYQSANLCNLPTPCPPPPPSSFSFFHLTTVSALFPFAVIPRLFVRRDFHAARRNIAKLSRQSCFPALIVAESCSRARRWGSAVFSFFIFLSSNAT